MKDLKGIILASMFAAITCVLSVITIPLPFTPVPVTLQLLGATTAGVVLGKKIGFMSQMIYVILGAIGIPVFAGGTAGFSVLFGPTGGYIFGFMASAYIIGFVSEKLLPNAKTKLSKYIVLLSSMLLGVGIIYVFGAAQLMIVLKLSLTQAIGGGVTPFIVPDIIKITVGSTVAYSVKTALDKSNLVPYSMKKAA